MTKRALVVEDDGNIAELLRLYHTAQASAPAPAAPAASAPG